MFRSPGAIAFHLGPLEIRWYGILTAASIALGLWLADRQARAENLPAEEISRCAWWAVVTGYLGARLYEGACDARATAILDALHQRGRARFGAAFDCGDHVVASASPERFLEVRGRRVVTSPIKGTRPRGVDAESDRAQLDALSHDPKEIAELTMVVDLERNDLGRVARTGSVRVLGEPRIESTRTVHHRVHDVAGVLRDDATLGELIRATLPSGSVTGAPKVRAMEIIATLEPTRRGLYCGAIFALDGAGGLVASMAIRSVVRQGGIARYHAGGGIVADSDPDREVAETGWKARPVRGA